MNLFFLIKVAKFIEINPAYKLNNTKVLKNETIYKTLIGDVNHGIYDDSIVAIKSFNREYMSSRQNIFINELINLHLIHSNVDSEQSSFFAQFIGFTLNEENDPFYGSILTKFYPLGTLRDYTMVLSNPKKFKNFNKFNAEQKEEFSKEIDQLHDLATQIALGIVYFLYLTVIVIKLI